MKMYEWEMIRSFTQTFYQGQYVKLNPDWPAHPYLVKEFGNLFPRQIQKVEPDLIHLFKGKGAIAFAPQVLTRANI